MRLSGCDTLAMEITTSWKSGVEGRPEERQRRRLSSHERKARPCRRPTADATICVNVPSAMYARKVTTYRPARLRSGHEAMKAKARSASTSATTSAHLPRQNNLSCFGRRPCRGGLASVSFVSPLVEDVRAKLVSQAKLLLLGNRLVVRPLGHGRAGHTEESRQFGLTHAKTGEEFGLGHTPA